MSNRSVCLLAPGIPRFTVHHVWLDGPSPEDGVERVDCDENDQDSGKSTTKRELGGNVA